MDPSFGRDTSGWPRPQESRRSTARVDPPDLPDRRFLRRGDGRGSRWKVWIVMVLALWAGYTALAGPQGLIRLIEMKGEERGLRGEVAELAAKLDSLRDARHDVDHDTFLQEKIAREVYGMARPDELIYYIEPHGESGAGERRPRAIPQAAGGEP